MSFLLEVSNLRIRLQTHRGPADAVRGVSFSLARGETLGLIGESGCGKSITAMSLMGLLPDSAQVCGSIRFDGEELVGRTDAQMCRMRGNRIGMVFQEPMTALNPVHSIGRQVAEPLRLHLGLSAAEARARALALLERVQLPQAAQQLIAASMAKIQRPCTSPVVMFSPMPKPPRAASNPPRGFGPMALSAREHGPNST